MDERREYIDEAMIEITQKMKRKHNLEALVDYKVLGWEENAALIEYPELTNDVSILR